jgi:hypothetical protein
MEVQQADREVFFCDWIPNPGVLFASNRVPVVAGQRDHDSISVVLGRFIYADAQRAGHVLYLRVGLPQACLLRVRVSSICCVSAFAREACVATRSTAVHRQPAALLREKNCRYNCDDDWKYEIGLFAPFFGIAGILFGLVYCLLACTLLSLLLAPRMFAVGLSKLWSAPYPQQNDSRRVASNDPLIALCQCIINSATDCCVLCTVMVRVFWSFVILIWSILYIPWSVVLGAWNGVAYGAGGYFEASKVYAGPHAYVIKYIADTKHQTENQNCGGAMF